MESYPPENSKLHLESRESTNHLVRQINREQCNLNRRREVELEQSLAPFRVGSVPYLNSAPLNRGLEDQLILAPPSELARRMRLGELDAALLSITEVLFQEDYDILDGIAVASLGEVKSVFLAHRQPLEEIQTIHCDPASRASVNLLKILLAEKNLHPQMVEMPSSTPDPMPDNVLLIGDPAIRFLLSNPQHQIFDLGTEWYLHTNLPFVFAVWALRRGVHNESLRRQLRDAKDFGMDTLDHIIEHHPEFHRDFRKDYLGWHIHFHLGTDEKRGIAHFIKLLNLHLPHQTVHQPHYVS